MNRNAHAFSVSHRRGLNGNQASPGRGAVLVVLMPKSRRQFANFKMSHCRRELLVQELGWMLFLFRTLLGRASSLRPAANVSLCFPPSMRTLVPMRDQDPCVN